MGLSVIGTCATCDTSKLHYNTADAWQQSRSQLLAALLIFHGGTLCLLCFCCFCVCRFTPLARLLLIRGAPTPALLLLLLLLLACLIQAILRAIFGYFMAIPLEKIPRLDIPLHTLIGASHNCFCNPSPATTGEWHWSTADQAVALPSRTAPFVLQYSLILLPGSIAQHLMMIVC
jgi:hypothetical protein